MYSLTDYNILCNEDFILLWSLILMFIIVVLLIGVFIRQSMIIKRLKKETEMMSGREYELQMQLKEAHEYSKSKNNQNAELLRYVLEHNASRDFSNIVKLFQDASQGKYNVSDSDWMELFAAVDEEYPEFNKDIVERITRITIPVLRTCYLVKIGMSNPQISNIMNTPPQTVWYRVDKIKKVLGESFQEICNRK